MFDVRPLLGIALKVLSSLVFTMMSAVIKELSSRYPVGELVFSRSAFALVPLVIWLVARGSFPASIRTQDPKGHVKRSFIGAGSMFLGFLSLGFLPLAEAIAIGYAAPLIAVALAALILKETVRAYRWSAVIIGFTGVVVMLLPRLGGDAPTPGTGAAVGVIFALGGACCSAGASIQVRRLTLTEDTGAIVFYFTCVTTLLSLLTLPFGWVVPTSGLDMLALVSAGILGGIGQILMTQSLRFGDASLIAPFEYSSMVWALLLGWFVFGEFPSAAVAVGAAIVAASGIFVVLREGYLARRHRMGTLAASLPPK